MIMKRFKHKIISSLYNKLKLFILNLKKLRMKLNRNRQLETKTMESGGNMSKQIKGAIDVSRYIINKCHDELLSISNLKLQKLLYFAQGYSLAIIGKPLFYEEIEAWDFGPVVPVSYREFKMYGANEIPKIESYYNMDFDIEYFLEEISFNEDMFTEAEKLIMDAVVNQFGLLTANDLVAITHNQLPWKTSYRTSKIISKQKIETFFNQYITENS